MTDKQQELINIVPEGPLRDKLKKVFAEDYLFCRLKEKLSVETRTQYDDENLKRIIEIIEQFLTVTTEIGREVASVMQEFKLQESRKRKQKESKT
jgi:hypothetical protein